jgi:molybdopterin molybdotransferase
MTEHSTGDGFGGQRDTAQVDLRPGSVQPPASVTVRDTELVGPPPLARARVAARRPAQSEPAPARQPRTDDPVPVGSAAQPQMRTVERHLEEILAAVPQPDPIELAVLDAQGLLCAEEVVSQRALPAFDQAALDGYAVRSDDVAGASLESPVELAVVGESVAGASAPSSIGPGLALKVAAGAMLPAGADVVVPAVWTDQGAVRVAVQAAPPPGAYVRRTGDDVAPGDPAVQVGTPIGRRRSACWPPWGASGCWSARGRGSPSSAPVRSWSTSAPPPRPVRSWT